MGFVIEILKLFHRVFETKGKLKSAIKMEIKQRKTHVVQPIDPLNDVEKSIVLINDVLSLHWLLKRIMGFTVETIPKTAKSDRENASKIV